MSVPNSTNSAYRKTLQNWNSHINLQTAFKYDVSLAPPLALFTWVHHKLGWTRDMTLHSLIFLKSSQIWLYFPSCLDCGKYWGMKRSLSLPALGSVEAWFVDHMINPASLFKPSLLPGQLATGDLCWGFWCHGVCLCVFPQPPKVSLVSPHWGPTQVRGQGSIPDSEMPSLSLI